MIVVYHKKGILNLNNEVVLKGGANSLNDEQASAFEKYKTHPQVKSLKDNGEIEWTEVKGDVKTGLVDAEYLKTLSVKNATDVVKNTIDSDLLKKWEAVEDRAGVKKEITKQLKKLATDSKDTEVETQGVEGLDASAASEELEPLEGND